MSILCLCFFRISSEAVRMATRGCLARVIMWETPHRCHQVCPACSLHRAARQLNIDQSLFFPENHIALVFSSTVRSRYLSNSCKIPSDTTSKCHVLTTKHAISVSTSKKLNRKSKITISSRHTHSNHFKRLYPIPRASKYLSNNLRHCRTMSLS
jgi:hypothetical protein